MLPPVPHPAGRPASSRRARAAALVLSSAAVAAAGLTFAGGASAQPVAAAPAVPAHAAPPPVTARDTTGASGSATFSWTIAAARGGCTPAQILGNPGFETGSIAPWTSTAGVLADIADGVPAHSGSWLAWLDGYGGPHTDTLAQTVTIPASCQTATLSFWLYVNSDDPANRAADTFTDQVLNASGTVLATLATFSNQNEGSGYVQHSYSLKSFIGQQVTIQYTGSETLGGGFDTNFFEDDNSLSVS